MVRGIVTINNITFSNGSQYIIVEEEVGLWGLWLFETVYETTESEQKRNSCFAVKMMTWPCSYIFFMTCALCVLASSMLYQDY